MTIKILQGDCRAVMATLAENSIDSIVTDPPYGLSDHKPGEVAECLRAWLAGEVYAPKGKGFMGKGWDAWVPGPEVWREALRVLKPGGHLLVFAGTRSMDLMSMAVRLAGFELRDAIGNATDGGSAPLLAWAFASGFPKSHNLDNHRGKLTCGCESPTQCGPRPDQQRAAEPGTVAHQQQPQALGAWPVCGGCGLPILPRGMGTALKPAWEPIILARKPLAKGSTVAANVLEHGTGALNIDACRVMTEDNLNGGTYSGTPSAETSDGWRMANAKRDFVQPAGRWPANLILSVPEDQYALRDDVTPAQLRQLAEWMDANA